MTRRRTSPPAELAERKLREDVDFVAECLQQEIDARVKANEAIERQIAELQKRLDEEHLAERLDWRRLREALTPLTEWVR